MPYIVDSTRYAEFPVFRISVVDGEINHRIMASCHRGIEKMVFKWARGGELRIAFALRVDCEPRQTPNRTLSW